MEKRDVYLDVALRQIPRILTLVDTDVTSPTHGCFDREYWHYRTADFPCGMSQEFVLPLALVFKYEFKDNPFYNNRKVRDIAIAGIRFAAQSAHKDGSCDDYFPHERAYGATAFSLYAMVETYRLLGMKDQSLEKFLEKRGDWLSSHLESGRLSNHHAVASLALLKLAGISGSERHEAASRKRMELCLSWQSDEGWFHEYEGCDPGYLTMTIDFLARYHSITKDEKVLGALDRALEFLDYFVYPDGTCGGEIGSRDTYIFMPHGFELLADINPKAASIKERYLECLHNRKDANLEDSRIFGRMTYSHLMAWLDSSEKKPETLHHQDFEEYFPESQLYVSKKGDYYLASSLSKGGVFKLFRSDKLVFTDTGPVCVFRSGKIAVSHKVSTREISIKDGIRVKGWFHYHKRRLSSPFKQVIFRAVLLSFGRFSFMRNIFRKLFQRVLITGKAVGPAILERNFYLSDEGLDVKDRIILTGKEDVKRLFISTDKVSIYTAMSECFHPGALLDWIALDSLVDELNSRRRVECVRSLE